MSNDECPQALCGNSPTLGPKSPSSWPETPDTPMLCGRSLYYLRSKARSVISGSLQSLQFCSPTPRLASPPRRPRTPNTPSSFSQSPYYLRSARQTLWGKGCSRSLGVHIQLENLTTEHNSDDENVGNDLDETSELQEETSSEEGSEEEEERKEQDDIMKNKSCDEDKHPTKYKRYALAFLFTINAPTKDVIQAIKEAKPGFSVESCKPNRIYMKCTEHNKCPVKLKAVNEPRFHPQIGKSMMEWDVFQRENAEHTLEKRQHGVSKEFLKDVDDQLHAGVKPNKIRNKLLLAARSIGKDPSVANVPSIKQICNRKRSFKRHQSGHW